MRGSIGARARDLAPAELARLTRSFVAAGRKAVAVPPDSPKQVALAIADAAQALAVSRRRLADVTPADQLHDAAVTHPEAAAALRALRQHREQILAVRGVVGVGIGLRRRGGVVLRERCVVVFVRRKWSNARRARSGAQALPAELASGPRSARVPVDIVELGRLERAASGGDSLGPTGTKVRGTLGSFAVDLATGATVALTAMHVSKRRQHPPGSALPFSCPVPPDAGAGALGRLVRGTMRGIDAAAISIDAPATASLSIMNIGRIRGWRPVSTPGDEGTVVRMFGAASGYVIGRIAYASVDLPKFGLESAILCEMPTRKGDSGAAIVDNENLVLGLLVGRPPLGKPPNLTPYAVFTPIGRVLFTLGCDIPNS